MKTLRKIIPFLSSFLSLWILCISTGFVIDFHFCESEIKNVRYFGKAEKCHDHHDSKAKEESSSMHPCCLLLKKNQKESPKSDDCCSHTSILVKVPTQCLISLQPFFAPSLIFTDIFFQEEPDELILPLAPIRFTHQYNIPPPLLKDIIILQQTFLC